MARGSRGSAESVAFWEEIPHLRVDKTANPVAIYKRLDAGLTRPLEERPYQIYIPVPGSKKGKRKSLKVADRDEALIRAAEELINLRVQLQQGVSLGKVTVEDLVLKFLEFKRSRIRGDWESKKDAGLRGITKARFGLIKGKLLNYLVPFLGEKTDARSVPFAKWNHWQQWRMENHARGHERPKAITIQNEMGMIRECWKWGMENSLDASSSSVNKYYYQERILCG